MYGCNKDTSSDQTKETDPETAALGRSPTSRKEQLDPLTWVAVQELK